MRQVIERKIYDTDTAEEISSTGYGTPGDFENFNETLYRTKKGNWFTAGGGGAKTKYQVQVSNNSWGGSDNIFVLTSDEAMRWLEDANETEALEKFFKGKLEDA